MRAAINQKTNIKKNEINHSRNSVTIYLYYTPN